MATASSLWAAAAVLLLAGCDLVAPKEQPLSSTSAVIAAATAQAQTLAGTATAQGDRGVLLNTTMTVGSSGGTNPYLGFQHANTGSPYGSVGESDFSLDGKTYTLRWLARYSYDNRVYFQTHTSTSANELPPFETFTTLKVTINDKTYTGEDNTDSTRGEDGWAKTNTYYYIRATDLSLTDGESVTVKIEAPPAKPTGVQAWRGNERVVLSWDDPDDSSITKWEYGQRATGLNATWAEMTMADIVDHGTKLSYTVRSLENGTQYFFAVRATNALGTGDDSGILITPAAARAGLQIADFDADKHDGGVKLTWRYNSAYSDITWYYRWGSKGTKACKDVAMSGFWGGGLVTVSTTYKGTEYEMVITDEQNDQMVDGETYCFSVQGRRNSEVVATEPDADDRDSAEFEKTLPPAPGSFSATAVDDNASTAPGVTLSWTEPSHSGDAITKYQWRFIRPLHGTWESWLDIPDSGSGGANATSYTVETLPERAAEIINGRYTGRDVTVANDPLVGGRQYTFQVRAYSTVPGTASASKSRYLKPNKPAGNGGPARLGYQAGDYKEVSDGNGGTRRLPNIGEKEMPWGRKAWDPDRPIGDEGAIGLLYTWLPPDANLSDGEYLSGHGQCWDGPGDDGQWDNCDLYKYRMSYDYYYRLKKSSDSGWGSWTKHSGGLFLGVDGANAPLEKNTRYDFLVRACSPDFTANATYCGPYAEVWGLTSPSGDEYLWWGGPPEKVHAQAQGSGAVRVSWEPPAGVGGDQVAASAASAQQASGQAAANDSTDVVDLTYEVAWTQQGTDWSEGDSRQVADTTATIEGLTNGQSYAFRVRGVQGETTGDWSETAHATPGLDMEDEPATLIEEFPDLSLAHGATHDLDMTEHFSGDGLSYGVMVTTTNQRTGEVRKGPLGTVARNKVTGVWTGDVLTLTAGPSGEHVLTLEITATDSADGTASDDFQLIVVAATSAPGAPAAPTLTAGDGVVTASWTAPEDDGGSAITSYDLDAVVKGTDWNDEPLLTGLTATSTEIANLTNGTEYAVRIRAVNDVGAGEWSQSANATPQGLDPATLIQEFPDLSLANSATHDLDMTAHFSGEGLSYGVMVTTTHKGTGEVKKGPLGTVARNKVTGVWSGDVLTLTAGAEGEHVLTLEITATDADGGEASDDFQLTVFVDTEGNPATLIEEFSDLSLENSATHDLDMATHFSGDGLSYGVMVTTTNKRTGEVRKGPLGTVARNKVTGVWTGNVLTLTAGANGEHVLTLDITATDQYGGEASDGFQLTVVTAGGGG